MRAFSVEPNVVVVYVVPYLKLMLSQIYCAENAPKLFHPVVLMFVVSRMVWAESWEFEHVELVDSES